MFTSHCLRGAAAALAIALIAGCASPGGNVAKDERAIKTAFDESSTDQAARTHVELGGAYLTNHQFDLALDESKRALAINPQYAPAFNLQGLAFASMDQVDLARDVFHKAIALDPTNPDTHHNFGWFLCQQKNYAAAQEQFQQALAQRVYRGAVRTWLAAGICDAQAGNLQSAKALLAKAQALDAFSPVISINHAEVLYRLGEFKQAAFYVDRLNAAASHTSPASLALAIKVHHALREESTVADLEKRLMAKFPESSEAQSVLVNQPMSTR